MNKLLPICLLTLSMVGCQTSFDYVPAEVDDILATSAAEKDKVALAEKDLELNLTSWWDRFDDPVLSDLIKEAYKDNRTLEQRYQDIAIANERYFYTHGKSDIFVDGDASYSNRRSGRNGPQTPGHAGSYSMGFNARWELDVSGALGHEQNAAYIAILVAEQNYSFSWISISGEIAMTYINLRTLQMRHQVATDNLELQTSTHDLLRSRYDEDIGDPLAMYQAEYNMQNTRATLPALERQIEATLDMLAVLLGKTPGTLPDSLIQPKQIPSTDLLDITEGIPPNLLRRRPDILAAERNLLIAARNQAVARANKKPRFFIDGSFGLEAIHSGTFLQGNSRFYSLGPVMTVPLFNGGQLNAMIEIRTHEQKQAVSAYEQTVLSAAAEVRTAASASLKEAERLVSLIAAVTAAQHAYDVADNKYQTGLTDFNNVLDAQRSLLSYQESEAVCRGAIATAYVALYKSLCGGWDGELEELLRPRGE